MPERSTPSIIAPLVERFERRRPLRAGSLIVTLYGDAIAPRGGSLWLGSLNELVAPFGIEPGLVRTAMSRLVADGWFDRKRAGKNSYYRLSSRGAAEFEVAARRIYSGAEDGPDAKLILAILTAPDAKSRQSARDSLALAGFGQISANVMVGPARATQEHPGGHADVIWLDAEAREAADLVQLAKASWELDALEAAYAAFLEHIALLARSISKVRTLSGVEAFRLRMLLIHEWRRIVLRDPQLPAAMLPENWPGHAARRHVAALYAACRDACEGFLDAHAVDETGRLPPAGEAGKSRFAG